MLAVLSVLGPLIKQCWCALTIFNDRVVIYIMLHLIFLYIAVESTCIE